MSEQVLEYEVIGRDQRFDALVSFCLDRVQSGDDIREITAQGFDVASQLFPLEHDRRSSGAALVTFALGLANQIAEGVSK